MKANKKVLPDPSTSTDTNTSTTEVVLILHESSPQRNGNIP
jgi:hypothetical protein